MSHCTWAVLLIERHADLAEDPTFTLDCWDIERRHNANTQGFVTMKYKAAAVSKAGRVQPAQLRQAVAHLASRTGAAASIAPEVRELINSAKATASRVRGSPFVKLKLRYEAFAMWFLAGPYGIFLTINPTEMHHPIAMFAAGKMHRFGPDTLTDMPDAWDRLRIVSQNPMACSRFVRFFVDAFIEAFLGFKKGARMQSTITITDTEGNIREVPAGVFGTLSHYL